MDGHPSLPTGTVTFLFTDIEGSTRLLQHLGDRWKEVIEAHQQLLRAAFQAWGGQEIRTEGDAFFLVFPRATDAVAAAVSGQRALAAHPWPEGGTVRVRMGLHTGEPQLGAADYIGLDVHRAARISAAGHGGQILLSQTTRDLVMHDLPEGVSLRELGFHRLKDLQHPESLFQLVLPDLPGDFPPLRTLEARPHNLPVQPTPLIGREQQVATVADRLLRPETRLVTLTGPGGTGKTRLGLQVAVEVFDSFTDGVFFIALAPISDPGLVASTIAQTLRVQGAGGQPVLESLKEYLRDKQILLLLDNFEQVLEAAPVVAELLASASRLKVLVTSRAVLHLRGENEFPVPPLALPDPERLPPVETLSQYAAVELFIQRAIAVKPDFAVTNDNAPAVAETCVRLDGLPLAIELAAARIRLLPPQAMLARLESRLKLLTGGARDLPARQQTLRNTIAWSYDLLGDAEKRLFRRLSVFVGGCTLEAVEVACRLEGEEQSDLLESVSALVEQSLLRQEEPADGEPRLTMLETIREYARERLVESGEADVVQRQHARFFTELAETDDRGHYRQEREHDNLRAALSCWVGSGNARWALRLAAPLGWFWYESHYGATEGRERLAAVLALEGASERTSARAMVLHLAANLAHYQGDLDEARTLAEEGLAIRRELDDRPEMAHSLLMLGYIARDQSDYRRAREFAEQSLVLYRELGNRLGIAGALVVVGSVVCLQGDYKTARALLEESLAMDEDASMVARLWHRYHLAEVAYAQEDYEAAYALLKESIEFARRYDTEYGLAAGQNLLAWVEQQRGNWKQAVVLCRRILEVARPWGRKRPVAEALYLLGRHEHHQGDLQAARALLEESLSVNRDMPSPLGMSRCLESLASVAVAEGKPERAARCFGAAEALREAIGAPLPPPERRGVDRAVTALRASCSDEAMSAAWVEGRAMTPEQAIRYALEEPPGSA